MFLELANFYRQFIQEFSQIGVPLTLILKTSKSTKSKIRPGKGGVEIDNSKAGRKEKKLDRSELYGSEVDSGEVGDNEVVKKGQNLSKSKKTESGFFTSGVRKAFTKLRQAFIKASILYHFDPERHIWVETDVSGYAIGRIFNQLISDNLGQWHLIAFFSRKMISAQTRYETHNGKLVAIVKAFKSWRHYLEESQHKVLVLTNHSNLHQFMETKSLSFR